MANHSTVKTVRIDTDLDRQILKNAKTKGVAYNTLVNSILRKYVEWDSKTSTYGYMHIPREMFLSVIEKEDDEDVQKIACDLGPNLIREMLQFWFNDLSINAFIDYVLLVSKYAGIASYEINSSGEDHRLTIHHYLGKKWSIFVANMYAEAMRGLLRIEPALDISKSQVTIKWQRAP